jgi:transposase
LSRWRYGWETFLPPFINKKEVFALFKLYVGIDVSKDFSTAQGLDNTGKKLFYLRFGMNAEGFSAVLKSMMKYAESINDIRAAMESTGCYHINLFSFLSSQGVACVVVNPLLVTNFAQLSLRKTKTDKKDALTIAQFLLFNEKSLSAIAFSQDTQDLKDLARERESLTILIAGMKNDIKRLLQGTFPELEKLCDPCGETMLNFLSRFPSARLLRTARKRDIEKALICPDEKRKRVVVSAGDIIAAAKTSVASSSAAKELILSEKVSTLLYLQGKKDRITEVLIETCESLRIEELDIIRSLDGVNDITGSTFLAELGDINNFSSYKHVIAFAGMDPSIHQSGQYEGRSTISKRGNRHLRRIIFLITLCAVRSKNVFREYFLRRKQEGLPPKKALLATAHKLVRVMFAMLSNKTLFRKGVAAQ